tara:strand:- start:153 stop:329 length:177 start_codon:yes stop_codon:yes gene_type:complete
MRQSKITDFYNQNLYNRKTYYQNIYNKEKYNNLVFGLSDEISKLQIDIYNKFKKNIYI